MKTITKFHLTAVPLLITGLVALADDKPAPEKVENQVKGVKQDAVQSVEKKDPPTVVPPAEKTTQGVEKVNGVNEVKGVKTSAKEMTPHPPAEDGNAPETVNPVKGIEAVATNKVKAVPPPPAGAVSTIQAVKGIQGIVTPKQQNLEAALLMKDNGPPETGPGNPTAAAAALLSAPGGTVPGPPTPGGDGRDDYQQFEKLTTPGS